ncbi:MAG: hypothetical protein R3F46_10375 [bacterium]
MPVCAALILLLASVDAASAQYYEPFEQGYELQAVTDQNSLLQCSPAPDVIAAQQASRPGTSLSCLLKLQSGMMRVLEQEYVEDLDPFFAEQRMLPARDWAGFHRKQWQANYSTEAGQVYIGVGIHYEDNEYWGLGTICSYLRSADGSFRMIAHHDLGHEYIGRVFVLDANHDGRLDVIASWMTGAGSGGGVDLLTVNEDGGISYFGDSAEPSDFASSLWSAHGSVELTDYDNDGDWELQLSFPLFFSAAGYYYRDIVSFDSAENAWSWDPGFAPDYYVSQDRFYERLYGQVQRLVHDPEQFHRDTDDYFMQYSCFIDGEEYSLAPFISDDGIINDELVEELRLIVEGGEEAVQPVGRILNLNMHEA